MASDATASSSSQRPHGAPQPTPVPATGQAASPPTKQSLKSWWKTFRPLPRAAPEPHGNTPHHQSQNSATSLSLCPVDVGVFWESPMRTHTPVLDGTPCGEHVGPEPFQRFSRIASARRQTLRRHSSFLSNTVPIGLKSSLRRVRDRRAMRNKRVSWHSTLVQGKTAKTPLLPKRVHAKRPKPILRFLQKCCLCVLYPTKRVRVVQPPTGIFGVPLRQSITYANVAISLVDAEGRSYIYGYVPIVVAKCGVYLKEKGMW